MKKLTVNRGNTRSKISSMGVGHPKNRRKIPIAQSIVRPASNPASDPKITDLKRGRGIGDTGLSLLILDNDFTLGSRVRGKAGWHRRFRGNAFRARSARCHKSAPGSSGYLA